MQGSSECFHFPFILILVVLERFCVLGTAWLYDVVCMYGKACQTRAVTVPGTRYQIRYQVLQTRQTGVSKRGYGTNPVPPSISPRGHGFGTWSIRGWPRPDQVPSPCPRGKEDGGTGVVPALDGATPVLTRYFAGAICDVIRGWFKNLKSSVLKKMFFCCPFNITSSFFNQRHNYHNSLAPSVMKIA